VTAMSPRVMPGAIPGAWLASRTTSTGTRGTSALVTHSPQGTRRYYQASREGLDALRRYVESLWDDVLAAYAASDPAPVARSKGKPRKAGARQSTSKRRQTASHP